MKIVQMVQTSYDGKLHATQKDAERHLDRLYTDKVSNIAVMITNTCESKYQKVKDFIDRELDLFIEAKRIKLDMQLYSSDTDSEEVDNDL